MLLDSGCLLQRHPNSRGRSATPLRNPLARKRTCPSMPSCIGILPAGRCARYLHGNRLTGALPPEWAAADSFTVLAQLTINDNPLGAR